MNKIQRTRTTRLLLVEEAMYISIYRAKNEHVGVSLKMGGQEVVEDSSEVRREKQIVSGRGRSPESYIE